MSLISIFESYLSFSFKASPNIHANESKAGEVHRLSGYLMERAVWGAPPFHAKSFSVPLPPPSCLPRY